MIPEQKLSSAPVTELFLHPDELFDYCMPMADYEMGGVALNDPSQGFLVRVWRVRIVNKDIIIDAPNDPEILPVVLLTTDVRASQVTLAFDQNMRPTIVYVESGVSKFWWYDTNIPGQTTTILGTDVITPRTFIDDKRVRQTLTSDILLFYLRAGALWFRAQRDRYLIEYWLKDTEAIGIARQGMTAGLRVQLELVYRLGHSTNVCGFVDRNNLNTSETVVSNIAVLNAFVSAYGEVKIYDGEYRLRKNSFAEWEEWTSSNGEISPGTAIQLRSITPDRYGESKTVNVDLAGFICSWSLSTREEVTCTIQFFGEPCLEPEDCLQFSGEEC